MNENETVIQDEEDKIVYEISFIFDNRLEEDKAVEKLETLKKDIASEKGSFISEETPYLRELSYEMIRVVNNIKVKFREGYFGWVKFELSPSSLEILEKKLKLDEEIVRFLIIKAEKGNDVFTKDMPVMKADPVLNISTKNDDSLEDETDIDTTELDIEEDLSEEDKKDLESDLEKTLETESEEENN